MRIADYLRLLLLAAIWGASFLFMRIAVPQFGAINTAFLRVFLVSQASRLFYLSLNLLLTLKINLSPQ